MGQVHTYMTKLTLRARCSISETSNLNLKFKINFTNICSTRKTQLVQSKILIVNMAHH